VIDNKLENFFSRIGVDHTYKTDFNLSFNQHVLHINRKPSIVPFERELSLTKRLQFLINLIQEKFIFDIANQETLENISNEIKEIDFVTDIELKDNILFFSITF
jgi:hypothetical protein